MPKTADTVRWDVPPAKIARLKELQRAAAVIAHPVTRYTADPVGFAAECFTWPTGAGLTDYQVNILAALPTAGRVAVRGPHGLGKTALEAIALLWFATTRDAAGTDWKIATTAGSWHQLVQYLWPEVHKWAARLRWDVLGRAPFTRTELQTINLRLTHGAAFAGASANAALIEGAHADALLFIYDEAKAIPANTFNASEGAFAGQGEALGLAMSTPGAPTGRFHEIHARRAGTEDWTPVHVTLAEAVGAGRVDADWAAQRARQWGITSALYANRVLGEFHADEVDSVIPLSWAEAAVTRWHTWHDTGAAHPSVPMVLGVDVARSGADATVLARRTGHVIDPLEAHHGEDTMRTAGRVAAKLTHPSHLAVIDVIGIGAGVVDRLREQGHKVIGFHASAKPTGRDRTGELSFLNARAEAWWRLRDALDPATEPSLCLPEDEELLGELVAPRYGHTSTGAIQVEAKADVITRLGRSTDRADAVIHTLVPARSGAPTWSAYTGVPDATPEPDWANSTPESPWWDRAAEEGDHLS